MALHFAALRLSFWIMAAIFHDCHSTRSCTLNFLRCCFAFVSYFSTHSQAIDRIHAARTSLLCCLVTVVSLQRNRNRSLYFVDHMPWSKCWFWWESNFQVTDAFPEHACVETSLVISTQTQRLLKKSYLHQLEKQSEGLVFWKIALMPVPQYRWGPSLHMTSMLVKALVVWRSAELWIPVFKLLHALETIWKTQHCFGNFHNPTLTFVAISGNDPMMRLKKFGVIWLDVLNLKSVNSGI